MQTTTNTTPASNYEFGADGLPDYQQFVLWNIRARRWLTYPALTKTRSEADKLSRFQALCTMCNLPSYYEITTEVGSVPLRWYLVRLVQMSEPMGQGTFIAETICTADELQDNLRELYTQHCAPGVAYLQAYEVFTGNARIFYCQTELGREVFKQSEVQPSDDTMITAHLQVLNLA